MDALKQAVLLCCEEKFAKIFGRPWEPACKTGLVAAHGRFFAQDQKARELWEELRRVVRKIEAFVHEEHLRPLTLTNLSGRATLADVGTQRRMSPEQVVEDLGGCTARAGALADWFVRHGRSVGTAHDLAQEVPPFPEPIRGLVIDAWEFVDPRYLPHQPPPPPTPPSSTRPMATFRTQPDNQTRALSNHDLAIVSLLCGSWPNVRDDELTAGITVGKIIDRERKNIEHARKHRTGPM